MRSLPSDVRYALRILTHAPAFSLAVIAVLALGIGANTAVFGIVNAVLLRPMPYENAQQVVRLFHVPPQSAFPGIPRFSVSTANFYDWKASAHSFENMAVYHGARFTLTGSGDAESVTATAVGDGFFEVLGTAPLLGRVFLPSEDAPGHGHEVVLSERFWKKQLAGQSDVIGRTLRLDGEAYTIVGVMPARFSMLSWSGASSDLWVPAAFTAQDKLVRDNHNNQVIARLRQGVTLAQANSEMDLISTRLAREYPQANTGWGAVVVSLQELVVGDIRTPLLVLLAAVALVLLIACANVANLLLARALGRSKEIAVRAALGAGRRRVFQQLIVESLALAGAGGAVGLLIAKLSLSAGATLLANQVPRADEIAIDTHVLVFVLAVALVTGAVAGVLPAFRAGSADLNEALKEGGRGNASVALRTRRILIAAEVALSVVLLAGAGLMIRSLVALRHVDEGFQASHVMTFRIGLSRTRYLEAAQTDAFFNAVLQRIRALPGVDAASAIDTLPTQGGSVQPVVLEGHAELLPRDQPTVAVRQVTPGYFRTLDIPVVEGRDVVDSDTSTMVVSRAAAKLLWGDVNPIGRRVTLPLESKTQLITVVGIAGDVRQSSPSEPIVPTIYLKTSDRRWASRSIAMRTSVPPASITAAAVAAVRGIDPEEPVQNIETMTDVVNETLTSQRFTALLLGLFSAVALLLASVGIYSVLSYIVSGRRREIGIRTALGARAGDVIGLVLFEGLTPVVIGLAAGIAGALGLARVFSTIVFGVAPSDPLTLALVSATILLVSLVATLVPAYHAARVDPLDALRA